MENDIYEDQYYNVDDPTASHDDIHEYPDVLQHHMPDSPDHPQFTEQNDHISDHTDPVMNMSTSTQFPTQFSTQFPTNNGTVNNTEYVNNQDAFTRFNT